MSLAERMAAALLQHGPMAECHLATTIGARKADVSAELESNPAFVHNDGKARASRWSVRPVTFPPDYETVEDDLVRLVAQGRECPYRVLLAAVCVMNGEAA